MAKMSFNSLKRLILESIANESNVQGFERLSDNDLKKLIIDQIMERIDASNVSDDEVSIVSVTIFGSRGRGTAREDSDLDVVLEYEGSMREDDLFNILHDEDYEYGTMEINGIPVDVNPIRKEETGSLHDFLKKSREYDRKILSGIK